MATIYEVAKAAGVTAATVSNVITGKGSVGVETRKRVEAAIRELGYQPNLLARGLATRQTRTVGLILPNIANPFYAEIALELEQAARAQGYAMFLCNTGNDPQVGQTYLQGLTSRGVDGVIVMPGGIGLEDLASATQRGLPTVLCNWEEQDELPALPMAGVDFVQAAGLAAQHLVARGHRRIGLVADAAIPHTRHTDRVAGFAATLAMASVPLRTDLLALSDSSLQGGMAAAARLLDLDEPPTALFCTNDMMAMGALGAIAARGLRVPEDISVVGFDDIFISEHCDPPLTTVTVPKRAIAVQTTTLLLEWLRGGDMPSAEPVQLPASLKVRRSTTARALDGSVGPGVQVAPASRAQAEPYRSLLDAVLRQ